jgi:hypothetical protein
MRTKSIKLLCVLALGLIICLPAMAGAVTSIGEPQPAGSWSQEWQENGVGNFKALEFFVISPSSIDMEAPGFRSFNTSGWTVGDPNPKYTYATNSGEITDTRWVSFFTGSATVGTTLDLFAWDGGVLGTLKDYARAIYDPSQPNNSYGWVISAAVHDPTGVDYNRNAVPLPPSVLLLGSGLLGMGLLGWRRKLI